MQPRQKENVKTRASAIFFLPEERTVASKRLIVYLAAEICVQIWVWAKDFLYRKSYRHFTTNLTAKMPQILPSIFVEIFGRMA
jgi:hypothetical protein